MLTKNILKPQSQKLWETLSGEEMYAHHLYIHIANQLQGNGLFGGQSYFEGESASELTHYYKIRDFVNDMGGVLCAPSVEEMKQDTKDLGKALDVYYNTELDLLRTYEKAYKNFMSIDDYASAKLVLEFIEIQSSSVGEAGDLCKRYEIAAASKEVLFFDKELKKLV